ncbi:MAG: hypothetical protein RLZZ553_30 [Verrucomicrobiota bacterium]
MCRSRSASRRNQNPTINSLQERRNKGVKDGIVKMLVGVCAVMSLSAEQTGPQRRVLCADDSKKILALVDAQGSVKWQHPVGPIHGAQILANGNVLFQVNWTRVVEVTMDEKKQVVWEYDAKKHAPGGKSVEIHAFQRLENGDTMIAESGTCRILEVSTKGEIRKQFPMKVNHPSTHSDTRQVVKLPNGHYLAAHERDGMVREYDINGAVVWDYEVPLFDQKPLPGHGVEAYGNALFGIQRLENGNTLIGCGNGHRVLEVTPKKEIVWKLEASDLPGIELAWICGVKRLPNGNTRFVNCHAGPKNPQMVEVDSRKNIIWTMRDFVHFGNSMPVGMVVEE